MAKHIFEKEANEEQISTGGIYTLSIDLVEAIDLAKEKKCYLLGKEDGAFILGNKEKDFFVLNIGYNAQDKAELYMRGVGGFAHDSIDSEFEEVLNLIKNESNYDIHLRSVFNTDFADTIEHNGDILLVKHAKAELNNYNEKNGTNYQVVFQSVTTEHQMGANCLVAMDGDKMLLKAPASNGMFGEWNDFNEYAKRFTVLKDLINTQLEKFKDLNMECSENDIDDNYMIYVLKSKNIDKYDALKVLGTESYNYHEAIKTAKKFTKEEVISELKKLNEDGVSAFVFNDYDKRYMDLMTTHFDLSEKFVDQWIQQEKVFQSLKKTPTEIVQDFTKGYLPVNPLKSIELNLLSQGYLIENREVLNQKIAKEQSINVNLKIVGAAEGVHVSIYRMPSGNYETVAYAVDLKNQNQNQNKPKL